MSTHAGTMAAREWAALFILALIWGMSFALMNIGVKEIPPFTLVLCRTALGAGTLLVFLHISGRKIPRSLALWRQFAVLGIINNVIPFSLIIWSQTVIPSGLGAILNATTPLWAVVLAYFIARGEATPNRIIGIILGFAGVSVLIGWKSADMTLPVLLGHLAVIVASACYAVASFYGRRFRDTGPVVSSFCQLTATSLIMIPVSLLIDQPWTLAVPGVPVVAAVIVMGVLCTAVAYILYFHILNVAGSTNITLVTFLIPVVALFIGIVFLGERLQASDFAGMGLIAAGLAAIDGRLYRRFLRVRAATE